MPEEAYVRNAVANLLDGLTMPFTPAWTKPEPEPTPCPPAEPAHEARARVPEWPPVTWILGVADRERCHSAEARGLANRDTVLLSLWNDTDDIVAVGCGDTNDFIVARNLP